MFSKKEIYIKTKSYNLIIIALAIYLGVVCYRTIFDSRLALTELYTISLDYCKMNFILIGLVMIGITFKYSSIISSLIDEGDKINEKIVLIGGGDVGRGNTSYETDVIDRKIVELTNKANPNFLFYRTS